MWANTYRTVVFKWKIAYLFWRFTTFYGIVGALLYFSYFTFEKRLNLTVDIQPTTITSDNNNTLFQWRRRRKQQQIWNKMFRVGYIRRISLPCWKRELTRFGGGGHGRSSNWSVKFLWHEKENAWNMCYAFLLLLLSTPRRKRKKDYLQHFENFHPLANPFWREKIIKEYDKNNNNNNKKVKIGKEKKYEEAFTPVRPVQIAIGASIVVHPAAAAAVKQKFIYLFLFF